MKNVIVRVCLDKKVNTIEMNVIHVRIGYVNHVRIGYLKHVKQNWLIRGAQA